MTAPCEFLPWDSQFFARRIARVTSSRLTPATAREVTDWIAAHAIDCAYFLADPSDPATLRAAARAGFDLIDLRVTLEAQARPVNGPAAVTAVRPARDGDLPTLEQIARVSHRDSRFYADGRFDSARCDELFATWIERSCADYADVVLVADADGRAVGYITGRMVEPGRGSIGLVAVDPAARGAGCGRALVTAILEWFLHRNAARVSVVTQGRNERALRFYQQRGFAVTHIGLWYHRWTAIDS